VAQRVAKLDGEIDQVRRDRGQTVEKQFKQLTQGIAKARSQHQNRKRPPADKNSTPAPAKD
jgi:hypothetical protein